MDYTDDDDLCPDLLPYTEEMGRDSLSNSVCAALESLQWNSSRLAAELRESQLTINTIVAGRDVVPFPVLVRLSQRLGVTMEEGLLGVGGRWDPTPTEATLPRVVHLLSDQQVNGRLAMSVRLGLAQMRETATSLGQYHDDPVAARTAAAAMLAERSIDYVMATNLLIAAGWGVDDIFWRSDFFWKVGIGFQN